MINRRTIDCLVEILGWATVSLFSCFFTVFGTGCMNGCLDALTGPRLDFWTDIFFFCLCHSWRQHRLWSSETWPFRLLLKSIPVTWRPPPPPPNPKKRSPRLWLTPVSVLTTNTLTCAGGPQAVQLAVRSLLQRERRRGHGPAERTDPVSHAPLVFGPPLTLINNSAINKWINQHETRPNPKAQPALDLKNSETLKALMEEDVSDGRGLKEYRPAPVKVVAVNAPFKVPGPI